MSNYSINVEIPVETKVVTVAKTATAASITKVNVDLTGYNPAYQIGIELKDDTGTKLLEKSVTLTHAQCQELMPQINDVLAGCRAAIEANLASLMAM